MGERKVDVDYVVRHCELVSSEHKMLAAADESRREEHRAMAQAADDIASHFRDEGGGMVPAQEVEDVARQLDPHTYAAYDALIRRLLSEGRDEGYATSVAEASYGADLARARSEASDSIASSLGADPLDAGYDQGVAAAIAWHEGRAVEADRLMSVEKSDVKRTKYRQRAERHRLYARQLKADLTAARQAEAARRAEVERRDEPLLPFDGRAPQRPREQDPPEEGIPLDVQMRFMRKSEVFDSGDYD